MENLTTVLIGIGVILLLVLLNGFFVASEFALVTVRKTRIDQLANEGNSTARAVQRALQKPNILLSATQLGVTMATLILGSTGEPIVTNLFQGWFGNSTWVFISSQVVAYILAYAIITAVEIIIGELVPKAIAGRQTERVALLVIRPLSVFLTVFRPFIWLLDKAAAGVLAILRIPPANEFESVPSEEELKMIVSASTEGGVLEESEELMLHRVLDFGNRAVYEVMVPRTEMVTISAKVTLPELLELVTNEHHTRFPVYEDSPDNIVGVLHVKDLMTLLYGILLANKVVTPSGHTPEPLAGSNLAIGNMLDGLLLSSNNNASRNDTATAVKDVPLNKTQILQVAQQKFDIHKILRPAMVVPDTMRVDDLMTEMKKRKTHMAMTIDEYGGTAGLVTLEDVLEEIVGDVSDEFDLPEEADIRPQSDGTTLVSGLVMLDRFNEHFKSNIQDPIYDTIAGFVLGQVGRKPEVGDEVKADNLTFRVEKMEGLRIALLRVSK